MNQIFRLDLSWKTRNFLWMNVCYFDELNWMTMLLHSYVFNCHSRIVKYTYFVLELSIRHIQTDSSNVRVCVFFSYWWNHKTCYILSKCWAKQNRNKVLFECLVSFYLLFSIQWKIFRIWKLLPTAHWHFI